MEALQCSSICLQHVQSSPEENARVSSVQMLRGKLPHHLRELISRQSLAPTAAIGKRRLFVRTSWRRPRNRASGR